MVTPVIATVFRGLWLVAEYFHARNRKLDSTHWDKFSSTVWDVGTCISVVGIIVGYTDVGRVHTDSSLPVIMGLAIMVSGLVIRWMAIHTLGRYFTRTVTIQNDHRIIQNGLYKHLRHPSYAGALLAHLGLGLAFTNWLSFGLIFTPILLAALYRMCVEEEALLAVFGSEYLEYIKKTKRLIPNVY